MNSKLDSTVESRSSEPPLSRVAHCLDVLQQVDAELMQAMQDRVLRRARRPRCRNNPVVEWAAESLQHRTIRAYNWLYRVGTLTDGELKRWRLRILHLRTAHAGGT